MRIRGAMTLPTFVVIGAMRAGTVSLRHYLDDHPDVFVWRDEPSSEPNFFVAEHRPARADDFAIPSELRDRLADSLAAGLDQFERLLGHQVPSDWGWSTSLSA
jgi:hypothetical protein